jgi:hypothetical protein
MLLDKYVLTKAFENLLSFHNTAPPSTPGTSTAAHQPPASFVKRVNQSMTRIDPILKTLQVRPVPPEGLVQAYLGYIGDRSDTNFRKILELKGVRRQDQAHLIELFAIHRDGAGAGRQLVEQSPLLTPLMSTTGLGSTGLAPVAAAGALQTRFDAASLGERLLNVARDGVERINVSTTSSATAGVAGLGITSPGGAVGGSSSSGAAPGGQNATINENLKNIGKFFRRDIGGLGARFGKRDVTPTGHPDGER